jgi:hypothetical protein
MDKMTEKELKAMRALAEDARQGYASVPSHKYGRDVTELLELVEKYHKSQCTKPLGHEGDCGK